MGTSRHYLRILGKKSAQLGIRGGYRNDKATLLATSEEERGGGGKLYPDPILPGDTQGLDKMKLSDRYENLSPGSYKLNIEYKTGETIEANGVTKNLRLRHVVTFEVIP